MAVTLPVSVLEHVVRVGASGELGGLLFVYCEGCPDADTETNCRHLYETTFDSTPSLIDPTPADLWRIEQQHLSEIAAATRSTTSAATTENDADG